MGMINGIEHTPSQLRKLVRKAGLRVERVLEGGGSVRILECRGVFSDGDKREETNGVERDDGANRLDGLAN